MNNELPRSKILQTFTAISETPCRNIQYCMFIHPFNVPSPTIAAYGQTVSFLTSVSIPAVPDSFTLPRHANPSSPRQKCQPPRRANPSGSGQARPLQKQFRGAFSIGKIQRLGRLRREGFPERLSLP